MGKKVTKTFVEKSIAEKQYGFSLYQGGVVPGNSLRVVDIEGIDRVKFRSMSVHKFSKQKSNYLSDTINSQSSKKLAPGYYNAN